MQNKKTTKKTLILYFSKIIKSLFIRKIPFLPKSNILKNHQNIVVWKNKYNTTEVRGNLIRSPRKIDENYCQLPHGITKFEYKSRDLALSTPLAFTFQHLFYSFFTFFRKHSLILFIYFLEKWCHPLRLLHLRLLLSIFITTITIILKVV